MSGSNERNDENYKHRNENEMNRPILMVSMNNLNTEINTTIKKIKKKKKNQTYYLTDRTTQRSQQFSYNSRNALNLLLITLGTSLGRHVKKKFYFLMKQGSEFTLLAHKKCFSFY